MLDWIAHIAIAVVVALLIITFVGQRTIVHDVSMQPNLYEGHNLIVEKISPKIGNLHRGDIVVIKLNDPKVVSNGEDPVIKRIIAFEGETLEIKDGKVFINGVQLVEEYIAGILTEGRKFGSSKLIVPKDNIFVMGDNRPRSNDSRSFGPVPVSKIQGKAIFRVWPFNKIGTL